MTRLSVALFTALALAIATGACGPTDSGGPDDGPGQPTAEDQDGDGFTPAQGDCNDGDATVNPGAADDTCDGIDNDCNGISDDPFNSDGDFYSSCGGDCDDNDPQTFPGATEELDGIDNDCDGIPDNNRPDYDDDGDGFTELDGDCDDGQILVNPNAVEVNLRDDGNGNIVAENADNDCDGAVDEGQGSCDTALAAAGGAMDSAKAIELCNWVNTASLTADADPMSHQLATAFGNTYTPHGGDEFLVLSTGIAVDSSNPAHVSPNGGTTFTNTAPHPDPQPDPADGCGQADPATVNDYVELTVDLTVPTNAMSLSFDFLFMSGEFPEWVCTAYDDTFMVIMESSSFTGNISFDDQGRPVTINVGFFDVCQVGMGAACTGDAELVGTGNEGTVGGGTGWLTTTAPVTGGETIRLRYLIFDEGDHRYDSTAIVDNFRWEAIPVDEPITVRKEEWDGMLLGTVDNPLRAAY